MRTNVKVRTLILATSIVCLIGVVLLLQRPVKPPREVDRSELVLVDGKLRLKDSTASFTGVMLDRYRDGVLQSRSSIFEGALHGFSEGFYTNGQIQVREHFNLGISHGLRAKWYSDGGRMSEAMIENGRLHGLFTRWHENGTIAEQMGMRDGEPDGICTAYYPDGSLKAEATHQDGKMVRQKFWSAGEAKPAKSRIES